MSNLKLFLKSLQRSGYPNSKTDVTTIARAMNYDLEFFVDDLIREIGHFKTGEFIEKTFSKLGLMSSPGLKIDMEDGVGGEPV